MTQASVVPVALVPTLGRRVAAEALGTALLLAAVVGSGVMGERLAAGNGALALLANTLATGAMLVTLTTVFGGVSGAHFNPLVTLLEVARRRLPARAAVAYVTAQLVGVVAGTFAAHAMFDLPLLSASQHERAGSSQLLSEVIATTGLLTVIGVGAARGAALLPLAIGGYVAAGYWFTASTCFANPVVTIARSLSDTFAGIRPLDVPGFVGAQLVGAAIAWILVAWLAPTAAERGEPPAPVTPAADLAR